MLFSFVLECALFRWAGGVWWGREHESSDHSVSLTFFIFFDSHNTTLAWFSPYLSQHPSSVHTAGCSTTWIGLLKHQCEALSLLTPQLCLGCVCVGGRGAVIVFIFRAPRFISQAQISLLGSRVMVTCFIDTFTFLSQIPYAESHCRLHICSPLMLPHPWKIKDAGSLFDITSIKRWYLRALPLNLEDADRSDDVKFLAAPIFCLAVYLEQNLLPGSRKLP